jgi:hypothetical protein
MVYGSAVHASLARFYRALMNGDPEPGAGELEAAFADAWKRELNGNVPVLLDDGETDDSALDNGTALVRRFHEQAPRPHRVLAVEEPFSIQVENPRTQKPVPERLVGVFDAVVQDADGSCHVLEHKATARRWSQDRLAYDLQVTAYSLAAPLMGFGEADVHVQLLLKTKKPSFEVLRATRSDQDRSDLLQVVSGVLAAIQAGAFFANRGWACGGCVFRGPCLAG